MSTESKASAGEMLRQGRLRQRLSIAECAKRTHISPQYLEALEQERWELLPSESHRLGFLRLYSRFLGVPTEEMMALYHQRTDGSVKAPPKREPSIRAEYSSASRWAPTTWQELVGVIVAGLILAWGIYHAFHSKFAESHPSQWVHFKPRASRLVVPNKPASFSQHVRVTAQADSWLRVVEHHQLLYEGILPAGSVKEWTGAGPFQFKIGNPKALSVYWNDQPVDILEGAHGGLNDLQLPLAK